MIDRFFYGVPLGPLRFSSNRNTRKHESTKRKTRIYEDENAKTRRRIRENTLYFQFDNYRVLVIVLSHLLHRLFVFSSSCFRVFVIVLSRFRHRTFVFSNKNAVALMEHRKFWHRTKIFRWYKINT